MNLEKEVPKWRKEDGKKRSSNEEKNEEVKAVIAAPSESMATRLTHLGNEPEKSYLFKSTCTNQHFGSILSLNRLNKHNISPFE